MVTPMQKFMVSWWPNSAALSRPVTSVATVLEYFLRIVSAYLKKNDDSTPCIALLTTSSNVICETQRRKCQLSQCKAKGRKQARCGQRHVEHIQVVEQPRATDA